MKKQITVEQFTTATIIGSVRMIEETWEGMTQALTNVLRISTKEELFINDEDEAKLDFMFAILAAESRILQGILPAKAKDVMEYFIKGAASNTEEEQMRGKINFYDKLFPEKYPEESSAAFEGVSLNLLSSWYGYRFMETLQKDGLEKYSDSLVVQTLERSFRANTNAFLHAVREVAVNYEIS